MLVGEIVGFVGDIDCDSRKPDGVPGKLVDTAKLNSLGWEICNQFRQFAGLG